MLHAVPTFYEVTHKVSSLSLCYEWLLKRLVLVGKSSQDQTTDWTPGARGESDLAGLPPAFQLHQQVNILGWMGRTAFEIVGQSGLGASFDPMTDEDTSHPFSNILKDLLYVTRPFSETQLFEAYLLSL